MAESKVNGSKSNGAAKEPPFARPGGGRWKMAEAFRNTHSLVVDNDVTVDDIKRPDFFSFVAKDIKRDDMVEVRTEDRRHLWLWSVVDAGMGWAQVCLLQAYEQPAATGRDPDKLAGFRFERDGVSGDWFAIREKDGARIGVHSRCRSIQEIRRVVEDHASNRR